MEDRVYFFFPRTNSGHFRVACRTSRAPVKSCSFLCLFRSRFPFGSTLISSPCTRVRVYSWRFKKPWSRRNVSTANTRTSSGKYVTGCCGSAAARLQGPETRSQLAATTRTRPTCTTTTCCGIGTTNRRTSRTPKNCSWNTPTTGV